MTDEMTMLREAFGPDEAPSAAAHDEARMALLRRVHSGGAKTRPVTSRHGRWRLISVGLTAAVAAVSILAVVVLQELRSPATSLPFTRDTNAVLFLENAAVAASQKPWTNPRPDQFMYKESRELRNSEERERDDPNGRLEPGKTRILQVQDWKRIDAQVWAHTLSNGQLEVLRVGGNVSWGQLVYGDLVKLTTPEAVLAWDKAPKNYGVRLDAILGQYVLPPAVEAAFFRALAQGEGVSLNPDAVNIDGRPAVGLSLAIEEGYFSRELLFDKETYALIGERSVAVADNNSWGRHIRKGDLFRQVVYTASSIVDNVGDLPS